MKRLSLALALVFPGVSYAGVDYTAHGVEILATFPIYDATGVECAAITSGTASLEVAIRTDVDSTVTEYAGGSLEAVGTGSGSTTSYGTGPTSGKVGISPVESGDCMYVLQIDDDYFNDVGASKIEATLRDGGTALSDTYHTIDMTGVDLDTFVAAIMAGDCTGQAEDTLGYGACDLASATHTAVTETLQSELEANTAALRMLALWTGTVETVTSQTVLVSASGPSVNDLQNSRSVCIVSDANSENADCVPVADYVQASQTWTLSEAMGFTVAVGDFMYVPSNDVAVAHVTPDAVTEVQSGLATSSALSTLSSAVAADAQNLFDGAISSVTSQTVLVTATGPAADDTHVGRSLCIRDGSDANTEDCALITDFVASTRTWTLANALKFTVATSDVVYIPPADANTKAMNSAEVCGNGQTGTPWTGNGC